MGISKCVFIHCQNKKHLKSPGGRPATSRGEGAGPAPRGFKFLKIYNYKKIDKFKIAKGLTQKLLLESKGLIGNKEKFYESIDKALTTYLKSKLNLDNSELNNKYIRSRLQQMKVEKNLIDLLFNVLENCQLARYTPLNIEAMSEDYENAKLFIEQLEKVKNEK